MRPCGERPTTRLRCNSYREDVNSIDSLGGGRSFPVLNVRVNLRSLQRSRLKLDARATAAILSRIKFGKLRSLRVLSLCWECHVTVPLQFGTSLITALASRWM